MKVLITGGSGMVGYAIQKHISNVKQKNLTDGVKSLKQSGGDNQSNLDGLIESSKFNDEIHRKKEKMREKAKEEYKKREDLLKGGVIVKKPKRKVIYKIYTNPNINISNDDKDEIQRVFDYSIKKRIKQQLIANKVFKVKTERDHSVLERNIEIKVKIFMSDIKTIPSLNYTSTQKGGTNIPYKLPEYAKDGGIKVQQELYSMRKGPQVGSKFFTVTIKGNERYVNENIFTENSEMTASFPKLNDGKPIDFY